MLRTSQTSSSFWPSYELYRSGEFFTLDTDNPEMQPLVVASLEGEAAVAATLLRGVLDRFVDARPRELDPVLEQSREGDGRDRMASEEGERARRW